MKWLESIHQLKLDSDIRYLKGVGDRRSELFNKLNIYTVKDLIFHQPHRWLDFSHTKQIIDLSPGPVIVKAQIVEVSGRYLGRRGLHLTEALVRDETSYLRVIWFNQPYRVKGLQVKSWYFLSGLYDLKYRHLQLINPSTEMVKDDHKLESDLIQGVYPATLGLKSAEIFKTLKQVRSLIKDCQEILPKSMIEEAKLKPLAKTLQELHFPKTLEQAELAKRSLGLRNLIALSLSSRLLKLKNYQQALPIAIHKDLVQEVIDGFDFKLTDQQTELIWLIISEMNQQDKVLNRLIQGDVSSGKTLIALLVAYNLICGGYQVAFIAPTQILAEQHYQTVETVLGKYLPLEAIGLLHAGLKPKAGQDVLEKISSNQIKFIIGTQSLLSERVKFNNLALVIIDEQHRFGVEQRSKLLTKTTRDKSNILTLSATPIPRSLALVIYADLDISLLTERPPKRLPIKTSVIALKDRASYLKKILMLASSNNLIYVICPAIDAQVEDSLNKVEIYLNKLINNLNYVCLHSRLKTDQKEKNIKDFKQGKYHVLISTSVVEAGIDIIKANYIIIMSPEQFGLAQLHQLRGRVGRADKQGYCYLCPYSDQPVSERLQAVMNHNDGFKLSEIDLKLRGPGTLYGLKQSGPFKVVEAFMGGSKEIKLATSLAEKFIKTEQNLDEYPEFKDQVEAYQQVTYLN